MDFHGRPDADRDGLGCGCPYSYHEYAKYDRGLKYHTLIAIDEYQMPWFELPDWEEFEVQEQDLVHASKEWLKKVGAI